MNLQTYYDRFPTPEHCAQHVEHVRWGEKPRCPYCGSRRSVTRLANEKRLHCNICNTSFSVTVGTVFQKTRIDLQKWFLAVSLVLNSTRPVTVQRLAHEANVNKNTASYMLTRLRKAMHTEGDFLEGLVRVDSAHDTTPTGTRTLEKLTK